jgi:uncharacterized protein (TIGR02145 family)
MKKAFLMLAIAATLFASCDKDNDDTPAVNDLAEKIVGKWMLADVNGQPCPTNDKIVQTFLSATKVTESLSQTSYSDDTDKWHTSLEGTCSIEGSTATLTFHPEDGVTTTCILNVQSITSAEMVASTKRTTTVGGRTVYEQEATVRMVKVGADQSQAILGLWEGHVTSEMGSEYDDGEEHRWEYLGDGSYVYYNKNANGQFVPVGTVLSQYFVDGTLLCTRWKNVGDGEEEHREWWEIESISDGVMNWTALRQRPDGTTYTATFQMTKVEQWVDLGLPSGLLWAKWNIGASAPEDYGDYFAWGETATKSVYDWSTYAYGNATNQLTKYCDSSEYGLDGFTDNLTTLEPGDDAATQRLGSDAHIPTKEEWQELIDNTTVEWTTQNGVNGKKFTAANGNTLFLPAAGGRVGSELHIDGRAGFYWSASLGTNSPSRAWIFYLSSVDQGVYRDTRSSGFSVRAVKKAN